MITFLTVLKSGGQYNASHVDRLVSQIDEHHKGHHSHICFSDMEVRNRIELLDNLPGWWSKLEIFNYDLGRVCYIDLDVVVRDSLNWIDNLDTDIDMHGMKDAWHPNLNSSVMIFEDSKKFITEDFTLDKRSLHGVGDQEWIYAKLMEHSKKLEYIHPPRVSSYKRHGSDSGSIVVYHGNPKPWNINNN